MKKIHFQLHYNDKDYIPMIVKKSNVIYDFIKDGEYLTYWDIIDIFRMIMIKYEKYLLKPV